MEWSFGFSLTPVRVSVRKLIFSFKIHILHQKHPFFFRNLSFIWNLHFFIRNSFTSETFIFQKKSLFFIRNLPFPQKSLFFIKKKKNFQQNPHFYQIPLFSSDNSIFRYSFETFHFHRKPPFFIRRHHPSSSGIWQYSNWVDLFKTLHFFVDFLSNRVVSYFFSQVTIDLGLTHPVKYVYIFYIDIYIYAGSPKKHETWKTTCGILIYILIRMKGPSIETNMRKMCVILTVIFSNT